MLGRFVSHVQSIAGLAVSVKRLSSHAGKTAQATGYLPAGMAGANRTELAARDFMQPNLVFEECDVGEQPDVFVHRTPIRIQPKPATLA
jgi:hypothetical protein